MVLSYDFGLHKVLKLWRYTIVHQCISSRSHHPHIACTQCHRHHIPCRRHIAKLIDSRLHPIVGHHIGMHFEHYQTRFYRIQIIAYQHFRLQRRLHRRPHIEDSYPMGCEDTRVERTVGVRRTKEQYINILYIQTLMHLRIQMILMPQMIGHVAQSLRATQQDNEQQRKEHCQRHKEDNISDKTLQN